MDEGMDEKEIDEQESAVGNRPPEVSLIGLAPPYTDVAKNARVGITCTASDPDGDAIEYKWAANGGSFDSVEVFRCMWRAPEVTGKFVVTVTVTDGNGGITTAQQEFTVIDNESPVIRGLSAEPVLIEANGFITVSGSAEDPDGDEIEYIWGTDGGTITGQGHSITWIAPDVKPGEKTDYYVSLTADDGRGGYDVEYVDVTVNIGYATKVFTPVPQETGTVIRDGGDDTSFNKAGDNKDDEPMRAFWSFNLYELRNTDVSQATIQFTHKETVGDPFRMPTGLRGIHVYVVRYDPGELPDFNIEPNEELTQGVLFESPTSFDVTKFVKRIGDNVAGSDEFQVMVAFQHLTNNDTVADYMSWDKVLLTVTSAPDV